MNKLSFEFAPSPTSNDHQVRIRIDGEDWLGEKYLGIDPPHFFSQQSLTSDGELLVGRCDCGCEGCDDVSVIVERDEKQIVWTNPKGLRLRFDRREYEELTATSQKDFSWEDAKRTAERLVTAVLTGVSLDDGYAFNWASARFRDGMITLSFSKNSDQKLVEFPWDNHSPENALAGAKRFAKGLERVHPEIFSR